KTELAILTSRIAPASRFNLGSCFQKKPGGRWPEWTPGQVCEHSYWGVVAGLRTTRVDGAGENRPAPAEDMLTTATLSPSVPSYFASSAAPCSQQLLRVAGGMPLSAKKKTRQRGAAGSHGFVHRSLRHEVGGRRNNGRLSPVALTPSAPGYSPGFVHSMFAEKIAGTLAHR